jgi:hypothetical protein
MNKWNLGGNWSRDLIERGSGHQCRVDQSDFASPSPYKLPSGPAALMTRRTVGEER